MEGENYRGRRNRQPVQTPPQTNRVHHLLRVVAVECRDAPPDGYDHPNFQGEHEPRDERRATYPSPRPRIEFDGEEPCDQGRQKDSGVDVLKKVDQEVGARQRNR